MTTENYFLTEHAFVREANGHAVFLDLRRNKYMAVKLKEMRDRSSDRDGRLTNCYESAITLHELVEVGILTRDCRRGRPVRPLDIEPAKMMFFSAFGIFPRITLLDFLRFVRAWAITTVLFRVMPLAWVLKRVQKRKASRRDANYSFDSNEAERLFIVHRFLAPSFYKIENACLRNSLTYIEFCASYRLYPSLIFGVKMEPFAAHAWVQEASMVLNDTVINVTPYAPILVI